MNKQHGATLTTQPYESLEDRLERGRQLQSKAVFDGLAGLFGKTRMSPAVEKFFPHSSRKLKHS